MSLKHGTPRFYRKHHGVILARGLLKTSACWCLRILPEKKMSSVVTALPALVPLSPPPTHRNLFIWFQLKLHKQRHFSLLSITSHPRFLLHSGVRVAPPVADAARNFEVSKTGLIVNTPCCEYGQTFTWVEHSWQRLLYKGERNLPWNFPFRACLSQLRAGESTCRILAAVLFVSTLRNCFCRHPGSDNKRQHGAPEMRPNCL